MVTMAPWNKPVMVERIEYFSSYVIFISAGDCNQEKIQLELDTDCMQMRKINITFWP